MFSKSLIKFADLLATISTDLIGNQLFTVTTSDFLVFDESWHAAKQLKAA